MSRAVTTLSWPGGTAVGSMMPMLKLSFQWLACQPSPKAFPVDQALLTRALQAPSMAKSLALPPMVQSMSAPACWLAPEHREAFRRGLRQVRREAAPAIDAARRERVEIARLLAEPRFDRSAIADALARSRLADLAVRERIEVYALDFATTLPASERDRFVDRLEEMGGLRLSPTSPTKGK